MWRLWYDDSKNWVKKGKNLIKYNFYERFAKLKTWKLLAICCCKYVGHHHHLQPIFYKVVQIVFLHLLSLSIYFLRFCFQQQKSKEINFSSHQTQVSNAFRWYIECQSFGKECIRYIVSVVTSPINRNVMLYHVGISKVVPTPTT